RIRRAPAGSWPPVRVGFRNPRVSLGGGPRSADRAPNARTITRPRLAVVRALRNLLRRAERLGPFESALLGISSETLPGLHQLHRDNRSGSDGGLPGIRLQRQGPARLS